jgi:hypothetical protein
VSVVRTSSFLMSAWSCHCCFNFNSLFQSDTEHHFHILFLTCVSSLMGVRSRLYSLAYSFSCCWVSRLLCIFWSADLSWVWSWQVLPPPRKGKLQFILLLLMVSVTEKLLMWIKPAYFLLLSWTGPLVFI